MTWQALRKRAPLLFIGMALVLSHCSCDFFGTTGAILVPESKEMQLGFTFDSTLHNNDTAKLQYPIFHPKTHIDSSMVTYVNQIAQEIVAHIPEDEKPGYDFKFTILDTNVLNAFAVPGGYVYIYTGIIRSMRDESELVGVLGHEITHVTHHHYRDEMAHNALFSVIIDALLGDDSGKLAQYVAGSLGTLATLKVSRDKEADADKGGTEKEGLMGRNPLGIAKFFSRLSDNGLEWFSTHPSPSNRVQDVHHQVESDSKLAALANDSATTNYHDRFCQNTGVCNP